MQSGIFTTWSKGALSPRFKASVTAVELTKGDYTFLSLGLTGGERIDFEPAKIEEEEDRNNAILLLKNADDTRSGNLLSKFKESSFLERDEYPATVSSMFEFIEKNDYRVQQQSQNRPTNQEDREYPSHSKEIKIIHAPTTKET